MINANLKHWEGTGDGGADTLTCPFPAEAWFVKNDGSADHTFTIGGQAITVKAGEGVPVHIKARVATINGASGGYRVTAYERGEACPTERQHDTTTGQLADDAVTSAKLADGALSADATGRAKMAAGFFGLVASSIAHFAAGFWTKAACDDKFAAGALAGTKLEDNALSADATGRGKMAAGFFGLVAASVAHFVDGFWTAAAVAAKFAAGSIAHSKLQTVGIVSVADADDVLTAAQLVDSGIFTQTPTAPRTLTTDTAAAIIAALPGQQIGTWCDITIVNQTAGAFDITLAPGAGVTITGSGVVSNIGTKSATWRLCVTGVGSVVLVRKS